MFDLKEIFTKRIVNSLYFDTSLFDLYEDSIHGSFNRFKCRIRWYGDNVLTNCNLEIKRKYGNVGNKLIYKLKPINLKKPFNKKIFNQLIKSNKNIDSITKINLFSLIPNIKVSYERIYFLSSDNKYRITLDKNIKYANVSPFKKLNQLKNIYDNFIVLEIKFDKKIDQLDFFNGSFLPLQKTRFSKYSNALEMLF